MSSGDLAMALDDLRRKLGFNIHTHSTFGLQASEWMKLGYFVVMTREYE